MKTIIVGLGNPILGDDGVGWKVVEELTRQMPTDLSVGLECLSVGGIGLMEHLIGYDRAIIIDAFIADKEDLGSILIQKLDNLPNYSAFHISSAHDTSLQNAIELGKRMGAQLPVDVTVIGIAIQRISEFGENLSPPVAECVPQAAHIALNLLKENVTNSREESHPHG
ncbi:MAG: hydrogenase maturation protease [Anaerolineales bacterium]|nr:hydrogenase maturation protease [Anaerolineales bacterium]MCK6581695.1 hydrogenase maturation protease [Anaerolineales bacterium]GJQ34721.1 MAG: hydrogenase expression/formation protein [Anaerolineaceae bacterium]